MNNRLNLASKSMAKLCRNKTCHSRKAYNFVQKRESCVFSLISTVSPGYTCCRDLTFNTTGYQSVISRNTQTIQSFSSFIGGLKCCLAVNQFSTQRRLYSSSPADISSKVVRNDSSRLLEILVDMKKLKIPYVWLRDHCRSERCYNHKTCQKIADLDLMSKDLIPAAVEFLENKSGILITWKDGHVTEYTFEFLTSNFYPGSFSRGAQKLLWDKSVIQSEYLPAVSYEDHMTKESGLRDTLKNIVKYGFTFVEQTPVSLEATQAVAERISFIYETIFGKMWSFTADGYRDDTAYTTQALGAHTDNTYLSSPAGLQVFHCLEHTGTGGETLLVDGFKAVEKLRLSDPDAVRLLSATVVPHEYKEKSTDRSPGHHLYSLCTVISTHPASAECLAIRYNPYDRAPLNTVAPGDIEAFYKAYEKLSSIIASPSSEFWVKLRPGVVLLVDNWRVLHGRAGFDGKRVVGGCYLPRDDWLSKARMLQVF